jgi:hypothetical protein
MDNLRWRESLPANCPPADVEFPDNFLCFRLVSQSPPTADDYLSQRALYPKKGFFASECQARSLSVFNEKSECEIPRLIILGGSQRNF